MARVNLVGSVDRRVPVLYLDLDGTVRHGKTELGRFVNHASDVVVFPEVRRIWRQWRARAAMRDWDERFAFEILGAWAAAARAGARTLSVTVNPASSTGRW